MILKHVAIESFGGVAGKKLDLKEGLNIVLGPNESGKSTIFNALSHCLFTTSKLTAAQFKKQMQRFVPIAGGDTISVSIDFECDGRPYTLNRRWGATKASSLTLPEGSMISDPTKIKETIETCLRVSEATGKSVMLAYQSTLSQTLDNLKDDADTLATLGDILRKSVMEMDGISVDVLKSRIEGDYKDYFNHWDQASKYPENDRGIENPYQKALGKVTAAFYSKERIRIDFETAVFHEKELDAINQKITGCASALKEKEDYVRQFKTAKEDALKRKQFESEFKACDLEYAKLEEINRSWPIKIDKHKELGESIPQLEIKAEHLKKEREKIQEFNRNQERVEKFKRVQEKRKQLEEARKKLGEIKKISTQDVAVMRKRESELQNLEARMHAGKLTFKFTPRKEMAVQVQEALGDEVPMTASAENPLCMAAEGSLRVSHVDWDMTVSSGDIDFSELSRAFQSTQQNLTALFGRHKVTTIAQAEEQGTAYRDQLQKVDHLKKSFEDELGDDDLESLRTAAAEFKDADLKRDLDTVLSELLEVQKNLGISKKEAADLQSQLAQYETAHHSPEKLLEALVDVVGRKKETQNKLSSLAPLPDGENDPDAFIRKFAQAEEQVKQLREDKSEYMQEKIKLASNAPDRSVEEFEKDLIDAREQFEAVLKHGEAVARIQETVYQLLEDVDSETYSTLEDNVVALVSKITDNKYTAMEMDESLPIGFKVASGETISYDLLSTGTQDVLAIALRLAFAREFLGQEKSFIMLDDPLVDLDPDRQARTAEVIRSFSEDHQVILFTCHPSHAEQLGGTLISI
jgi:exonuclease SbcC